MHKQPRKNNRKSLTRNLSESIGGNGTASGDSDDRDCLAPSSYTSSYTSRWNIGTTTSAFSGPVLDGCLGGF
jgi:hypothetical protein